eukprot:Lankesteria_metandrocarpae@DN5293_c0_g2_i1.p1
MQSYTPGVPPTSGGFKKVDSYNVLIGSKSMVGERGEGHGGSGRHGADVNYETAPNNNATTTATANTNTPYNRSNKNQYNTPQNSGGNSRVNNHNNSNLGSGVYNATGDFYQSENWLEKVRVFNLELAEGRCVALNSAHGSRTPTTASSRVATGSSRHSSSFEVVAGSHFMGLSVMLAFSAVLCDFNEFYGQRYLTVKAVQRQVLSLRDIGKHEDANELESLLDWACQVRRKPLNGQNSALNGDGSSEATTREPTESLTSQASRNFTSIFSVKSQTVDRSDRLDLVWMRAYCDEEESSVAFPEALLRLSPDINESTISGAGGSLQTQADNKMKHVSLASRRFIKDRRRKIKDISKRCSWTAYDVYNAHLVLDYLEQRLPTKPKRSILDRLLRRKRMMLLPGMQSSVHSMDLTRRPTARAAQDGGAVWDPDRNIHRNITLQHSAQTGVSHVQQLNSVFPAFHSQQTVNTDRLSGAAPRLQSSAIRS